MNGLLAVLHLTACLARPASAGFRVRRQRGVHSSRHAPQRRTERYLDQQIATAGKPPLGRSSSAMSMGAGCLDGSNVVVTSDYPSRTRFKDLCPASHGRRSAPAEPAQSDVAHPTGIRRVIPGCGHPHPVFWGESTLPTYSLFGADRSVLRWRCDASAGRDVVAVNRSPCIFAAFKDVRG